MSKTIEQQVEEIVHEAENEFETGDYRPMYVNILKVEIAKALQERDRIAYERGIAKGRKEEREKWELDKYFSEFEVVDGINQHKDGLNFEQWKQALTTPLKNPYQVRV